MLVWCIDKTSATTLACVGCALLQELDLFSTERLVFPAACVAPYVAGLRNAHVQSVQAMAARVPKLTRVGASQALLSLWGRQPTVAVAITVIAWALGVVDTRNDKGVEGLTT